MVGKLNIFGLVLMLYFSIPVYSQAEKVPPVRLGQNIPAFAGYRPVGETRLWTFVSRDSTIGQLISVVKEEIEINGRHGYVINNKLAINYRRPDNQLVMEIQGDRYVSDEGYYLGDKLKIKINDITEKFEFELKGDVLEGFFTRSGKKESRTIPFPDDFFAWENYFVDQLELFLAMKNIRAGDTLVDSLYLPQSMYKEPLFGTVDAFLYKELYQNKFDSVYQIHLTLPQEFHAFLTRDGKLVRLDFPHYRIRAYLDLVRQKPPSPTPLKYGFNTFLSALPSYVFYLIVAVFSALFLALGGFRWRFSYLAFLIGAVVYFLMLVTQIPIQKYIITRWLVPLVTAGGSLYVSGWLPALAAGLIQETVKLATIIVVLFGFRIRENRFLYIGTFCGVGFGFMEACYLARPIGILNLFSGALLESSFLILFHALSGTVLGYALSGTSRRIVFCLTGLVLFNTFLRYLPVFVQQQAVGVELMYFVFAFVTLSFLALTIIFLKKRKVL